MTTNAEHASEQQHIPESEPAKHKAVKKKILVKAKADPDAESDELNFDSFGARRQSRLYATLALYHYDIMDGKAALDDILRFEYAERPLKKSVREYAESIVQGTVERLPAIDDAIRRHSTNWNIERIGFVDRAILRISVNALFYQPDVPRSVVIDEAIEIAKLFCDAKSYKFINGILDGIDRDKEKPQG